MPDDWLNEARTSFDTIAAAHTNVVSGLLDDHLYLQASLALFADLGRGGPVADIGLWRYGLDLERDVDAVENHDGVVRLFHQGGRVYKLGGPTRSQHVVHGSKFDQRRQHASVPEIRRQEIETADAARRATGRRDRTIG